MARYENTKIKYNIINEKSLGTTLYNKIPERDDDLYIITQYGDRLDTLAHHFYGTPNLWWYLAKANHLTFVTIPVGTSLRIPASTEYAVGT
jgi:hypothetical protein